MLIKPPMLHYFKSKNDYSGAHFGMRYYFAAGKETITKEDGTEEEVSVLKAVIWPDPWAREYTDPALHIKKTFPFTEEGREQAQHWLEDTFHAQEERWRNCPTILDCDPWKPAPPAETENSAG